MQTLATDLLMGGKGFIWVSMPYIQKGKKENAVTWWGDRQATIDYCKVNLPRSARNLEGIWRTFICGFSRGAIACSYIGLADDEIASFWKGMIAHDHFDGQNKWGYPESDRTSALKRLARLARDARFFYAETKMIISRITPSSAHSLFFPSP